MSKQSSFLFISTFLLFYACIGQKQHKKPETTTVYIVRHAEKDTTYLDKNPSLNEAGKIRAEVLDQRFIDTAFALILSTDRIRTKKTVENIAIRNNIPITIYENENLDKMADEYLKKYSGTNILISGHSNTILQLVKAFGGQTEIKEILDQEYDNIFKITIIDGLISTENIKY